MRRLVWYLADWYDRATFASLDWAEVRALKSDDDLLEGARVPFAPGGTFRLAGTTFSVAPDGATITTASSRSRCDAPLACQ